MALATVLVVFLSLLFRLGVAQQVQFKVKVGAAAFDTIHYMLEEHGAAWGMRRDVVIRAEQAINEAVNSVASLNPELQQVEVEMAFDEFKLDAEIVYEGVALEIADAAPSVEELGTDQGIAALSTFMIRQYADRIRMRERKGLCRLQIHLDH